MSHKWKYPPTELPWNVESGSIVHPEKGELLKADRNNPNTYPVERDSNIHFARLAATYHDRLIAVLEGVLAVDVPPSAEMLEGYKLLHEIKMEYERLDR